MQKKERNMVLKKQEKHHNSQRDNISVSKENSNMKNIKKPNGLPKGFFFGLYILLLQKYYNSVKFALFR